MHGLRLFLGASLAALFALAGCDSATDPQPLGGRPPEVSDFAFSPDSVFFDDALVSGDSAGIELTLSVRAADPDGTVDRVQFSVQGQFEGTIASGALALGDDGRYAATAPLLLGRGQRGLYSLLVYAVDDDGLLSNQVRGQFELAGRGLGPPVVEAIDAPAEFQPPGLLVLVAVVSDPDGLSDIARVEVTGATGAIFQLFDDGQTSGDETAGDGRYTASFDVPEATPGPQTFVFRAFDRDGLVSDDVPFTITILEPLTSPDPG
ncbi:MAG: choice-of-anchor X domain-containing protein [Bacteroidota bacterium]